MQMENESCPKRRFIIVSFLFCLSFSLFPLPAFSQTSLARQRLNPAEEELYSSSGKTDEKLDFMEGPDIEYAAGDFRDPFYPQIFISEEQETEVAEVEPEIEREIEEIKPKASELFSLSIQGIIWNSDKPLAIINDRVFKKGEVLSITEGSHFAEPITIMDIDKDGVTIIYSGQVEKLSSPKTSEFAK
jgi:hypothetical protein